MTAGTLFYNPMQIPVAHLLWLVIPLCASVAVVYKTVRTESLRRLPREILGLIAYMIGGLIALGVALWLVQEYWP